MNAFACRNLFPALPGFASASHRRDDAGWIDAANAMIAGIGDVDVAKPVGLHIHRSVQAGLVRGSAIAAVSGAAGSGDAGDHAVRNFADAMIRGIGDIQHAVRIQGDAHGTVQRGAVGGSAIARGSGKTSAGHRAEAAIRLDAAHAITMQFREIHKSPGIDRECGGPIQRRARRGDSRRVDIVLAAACQR